MIRNTTKNKKINSLRNKAMMALVDFTQNWEKMVNRDQRKRGRDCN